MISLSNHILMTHSHDIHKIHSNHIQDRSYLQANLKFNKISEIMSKSKISENDLNFKQISKESLTQLDTSRIRKEKISKAYYTNLATLGGQLKDWKDCTQLTNQEMNALSEHEKIQFKIIS